MAGKATFGQFATNSVPREADASADWVHRFGPTIRFGHWWTVAMMAVAGLSGLALGDDGSGPMLVVHIGAVVALAVMAVAILLFGNRRSVLQTAGALLKLDRSDRAWLAGVARHPLRRPPEPRWGMFNAGQKLMGWALAGSIIGLVATGLLAWSSGGEGGLHPAFAVLTGGLIGAHVFMAVVNPSTRHALNAMISGKVRRTWAAQHHPGWLSHAAH